MGCDYFVDEDKDDVIVEIIDYSSGEVVDRIAVNTDKFENGKMDVRIKGADLR